MRYVWISSSSRERCIQSRVPWKSRIAHMCLSRCVERSRVISPLTPTDRHDIIICALCPPSSSIRTNTLWCIQHWLFNRYPRCPFNLKSTRLFKESGKWDLHKQMQMSGLPLEIIRRVFKTTSFSFFNLQMETEEVRTHCSVGRS